jgi:hypothetical protein
MLVDLAMTSMFTLMVELAHISVVRSLLSLNHSRESLVDQESNLHSQLVPVSMDALLLLQTLKLYQFVPPS